MGLLAAVLSVLVTVDLNSLHIRNKKMATSNHNWHLLKQAKEYWCPIATDFSYCRGKACSWWVIKVDGNVSTDIERGRCAMIVIPEENGATVK